MIRSILREVEAEIIMLVLTKEWKLMIKVWILTGA